MTHTHIYIEQLNGNGAWVENKVQSLTFHYRDVPQAEQASYKERATGIIESYGFLANPAHAAVEAKPAVKWNKGESFCIQCARIKHDGVCSFHLHKRKTNKYRI